MVLSLYVELSELLIEKVTRIVALFVTTQMPWISIVRVVLFTMVDS